MSFKHRSWLFALLLALWLCTGLLLGGAQPSGPAANRSFLLISLDGLRPDYILKADEHGLKIPNLRRILHDIAHRLRAADERITAAGDLGRIAAGSARLPGRRL